MASLGVLDILPEDPSTIPSTPMVAVNSGSRKFSTFFRSLQAPDTQVVHMHTCRKNSHEI